MRTFVRLRYSGFRAIDSVALSRRQCANAWSWPTSRPPASQVFMASIIDQQGNSPSYPGEMKRREEACGALGGEGGIAELIRPVRRERGSILHGVPHTKSPRRLGDYVFQRLVLVHLRCQTDGTCPPGLRRRPWHDNPGTRGW